jgi:hypothetical protein
MIQVKAGTVRLTEQTVRELLSAIEEAKRITTFTNDPIPDGNTDSETLVRLMRERGVVTVKSEYSDIEFQVDVEKRPKSQECPQITSHAVFSEGVFQSLGYKLALGSEVIRIGSDGRCLCKQSDKCPLGRAGSAVRCTKAELEAQGVHVIVDEITQKE